MPFGAALNVPAVHWIDARVPIDPEKVREWSKMSAFLGIKYGLIDAQKELETISRLESNWDSYGAAPPSTQAVEASRQILRVLSAELILPSRIVASASGGVSIYFFQDRRNAYIESYNDGTQALVLYGQDRPTEVLELGTDIRQNDVGDRLSSYLDQR